jgi:hypothetical protein
MTNRYEPDQIASARLGEVGRVWTSALSVSEFALLDAAGFLEWFAQEWMWGAHTLEFFTSGTAVRKVADGTPISPSLVLPPR